MRTCKNRLNLFFGQHINTAAFLFVPFPPLMTDAFPQHILPHCSATALLLGSPTQDFLYLTVTN